MGTQFFWFYDLIIVAILIGAVLKCARKGFAGTIMGFLALFVAFCVAWPFSETIGVAIYDNVVEDALISEMDKTLGEALDGTVISQLDDVDMGKAKVNGREIDDLNIQPDPTGKVSLDLSGLDVTGTGIENVDLSVFGINQEDFNYSSLNLGTVQFTQTDLEQHGLEAMLLSSVLANEMSSGTAFGAICGAVDKMAQVLPMLMGDFSQSVNSGDRSALSKIMLSVIETQDDNFAMGILDSMVKPVLLVPIRALIFILIFVIILIAANLLVKALKLVNKIPLVGSVNIFLGAVVGVLEAAVTVFIVCIGVQMLILFTGNSLIFLNTMTIDNTYLFRHIYYFDFLNFLL